MSTSHPVYGVSSFSSTTYFCEKFSTFAIYNLAWLQSTCSMLALKELDLNCGGKAREFQKSQSIIHDVFRKMHFFRSVKIILIETESGSNWC
jgi:hypothetical protein